MVRSAHVFGIRCHGGARGCPDNPIFPKFCLHPMPTHLRLSSLPGRSRSFLPVLVAALVGILQAPQALAVPGEAAPKAAQAAGFDILEYLVEGNTVLPAIEVERAVYPHLGPGKDLADVEKARTDLEKAYHDAGYLTVAVDIPEQQVKDGVVVLKVVEGKVERLKVSGNRYHLRSDIRAAVPSLAPEVVPNFTEVQNELGRLASADRQVAPLLRPGRQPGTVEVELAVEDKLPLHGSVELNSKQSPDTSEGRLEASIRYQNLWQRQHSLGLGWSVSPQKTDEVNIFSAFYSLSVGQRGDSLSLYAVHSSSNIATVAASGVVGKGNTFGLRYVVPMRGAGTYTHQLLAGFDYKDLQENTTLVGTDTTSKPLRYLPLALQYSAADQGEVSSLEFNLGLTLGLRGLMEREVLCDGIELRDQFDCRRRGAKANFTVARGDVAYRHRFGKWGFLARLEGQTSSQPLVSPEQFTAGGFDSVRGYLESEALGDKGFRLRLELTAPAIALGAGEWVLTPHVFYDEAHLVIKEPLPEQEDNFTLASLGLGFRLAGGKNWLATFEGAHTLNAGPRTPKGYDRGLLGLKYQF